MEDIAVASIVVTRTARFGHQVWHIVRSVVPLEGWPTTPPTTTNLIVQLQNQRGKLNKTLKSSGYGVTK